MSYMNRRNKVLIYFCLLLTLTCAMISINVNAVEGDYIGVWSLNGLNDWGADIATDGTNIWVADLIDKAVYKYDMVGNYIGVWSTTGLNDNLRGITTDGTNIWVVDYTDDAVYKYDMVGNYIGVWSTTGLNDELRGITTDGTNIWLTDRNEKAVFKYDMVGNYIGVWSTTGLNQDVSGVATDGTNIWIPDHIDDAVYKYDMVGNYIGVWSLNGLNDYPYGITTDGTNIWIADNTDDAVYKYEGSPPADVPTISDEVLSLFIVEAYDAKWVRNMLVSDTDGRTTIDYVEIALNMTSGDIVLRWDEDTKVFSEILDTGGLCTINTVNSTWEVYDANTYRLEWRFEINGGVLAINQDWRTRAIDEDSNRNPTFSALQGQFEYVDSVTMNLVDFNIISNDPIFQAYPETEEYNEPENLLTLNITVSHNINANWIFWETIGLYENITGNVLMGTGGRLYTFWSWLPFVSTGNGSNDINLGTNTSLKHGTSGDNKMWFTPVMKVHSLPAGRYNLSVTMTDFGYDETKYFLGWVDIGDSIVHNETSSIDTFLLIQEGVEDTEFESITQELFIQKGVEVNEVEEINQGVMIWVNGVLAYSSFEHMPLEVKLGDLNILDSEGNIISNDGWLYEGELYRLRAVSTNPSYININVSDTRRTIAFEWYNSTGVMSITSTDGVNVFGLINGDMSYNETSGVRIFEWYFVVNDNVVDCANRYWDAYMYSTINAPLIPLETDIKDNWLYTNIYNLGGSVSYTMIGDGHRLAGGDVLDIEATSIGSSAYTEVIFNNLQSVHILPELDYNGTWNSGTGRFEDFKGGYFEYGISYEIDDVWVNGWKVRLFPHLTDYSVGHQNAGADNNWIGWVVQWYKYDYDTSFWIKERTDRIYSNSWGYDEEGATPDYHNRTSSQLWIDLWFSNHNSSSIVAGRVNSLYYGLYEQATPFWFGYGEFRPMFGEERTSMYFSDLTDTNDEVTDSYGIGKVKFWTRITKLTQNESPWRASNYEIKDYMLSEGRMRGIDNPPLVETRVLDSPASGFLSPLIRAIAGIAGAIARALRGTGLYAISLVDGLLTSIGLPPMLGIFFDFLLGIYEIFALIYGSFRDIVSWMITSIENMISSLFLVIPRYLLLVNGVLMVFISYYTNFVLLFTGGIGNMNNFWVDYSVGDILQIYLIAVLPFTYIAKWESSKDPIGAIGEDAKSFIGFIMAVFEITRDLFNVAFDIIKSIIGLI